MPLRGNNITHCHLSLTHLNINNYNDFLIPRLHKTCRIVVTLKLWSWLTPIIKIYSTNFPKRSSTSNNLLDYNYVSMQMHICGIYTRTSLHTGWWDKNNNNGLSIPKLNVPVKEVFLVCRKSVLFPPVCLSLTYCELLCSSLETQRYQSVCLLHP